MLPCEARAVSKIPAASIVQADARRPGTLKEVLLSGFKRRLRSSAGASGL